MAVTRLSRRRFLAGAVAASVGGSAGFSHARPDQKKARIAITLDLEMSRHYPKRGMMEWDFQKGNLDEPTKRYSVEAARVAKAHGGLIHYFCVGRVLEHKSVDWLKQIIAEGHPVGNHTYDHVHMKAKTAKTLQFRFERAPWLVKGRAIDDIVRENIALTTAAMSERLGIAPNGFRTPGGFHNGLDDRPDLQRMLLDLGFRWVSSKYPRHEYGEPKKEPTPDVYDSIVKAQAAAQPYVYPSGLLEIPMSPISDVGGFRSTFWKLDWFLEAVRRGVQWAIDHRAVYDFLAHPSCLVVEDPEFRVIKLICELVREAGDRAEIVSLDTVAKEYLVR